MNRLILIFCATFIFGCEGGFKASSFKSNPSGLGGDVPPTVTTTTLLGSGTNGIVSPTGMFFSVRDVTFRAQNAGPGETYAWSYSLSGRSNLCIEDSEGAIYQLFCESPGNLTVNLRVTRNDGSTSDFQVQNLRVFSQHEFGTVEFVIPEGTANQSWNSEEKVITLRVGDTFVVKSDDSTRDDHCLHTPGNRPTRHCDVQNPLSKGQSETFEVIAEYDPFTDPGMTYDHFVNPNARVWVRSVALDGPALYQRNCASCHGALATSERRNAKSWQIQHAIFNQPQMSGLSALTDEEVGAIARELNN